MLQTTHLMPSERLREGRPRSPRMAVGDTSGRAGPDHISVTGISVPAGGRRLHLFLRKLFAFITTFDFDILQRYSPTIRGTSPPLIPDRRLACNTISTHLYSTFPTSPPYPVCHVKRWTSEEDVTHLPKVLSVAYASDTRRRNLHRESPEILGRTLFFVLAVGRAPPQPVPITWQRPTSGGRMGKSHHLE